ncbi:MAG: glycosyltransferase family 32 protein [Oliverpabstia sp.]
MIPKKIHYCWFGRNELPSKAKKCIDSWKKYCPDYEIIEWNEDNYDINQNPYTEYTYQNKKYAFLSDYARLQIIYNEGGIYFDVDVEVIRSLDELLQYGAFFGFETDQFINTGLGFGAEKGNCLVEAMLQEYDQLLDGTKGTIGCPILNTSALKKHGLVLNGEKQTIEDAVVFPASYFNPYDDPTGKLNVEDITFSIHWFAKSWLNRQAVLRSIITKPIHRIFGTDLFHKKNKKS